MREISVSQITDAIEKLCIEANTYLPDDVKCAIARCRSVEDSEIAKGILDNIIENNEKALIFTQYKQMGEILEPMLASQYNIQPLFFHGSLNVKQREEMLEQFKNDEDKKIMILYN